MSANKLLIFNLGMLTANLLGKISDAQATLVNQMEANTESLEGTNDEHVKMIGVSSIGSIFSNIKLDDKGSEEELTLARRWPHNSEGEN